jgi:hypothetical protein
MIMPKLTVDLNIAAEQMLLYYQGSAQYIQAYSVDGQSVRFPALLLREFVTATGVQGRFVIYYSYTGKCETIMRVK